jgi:hypothetical protein
MRLNLQGVIQRTPRDGARPRLFGAPCHIFSQPTFRYSAPLKIRTEQEMEIVVTFLVGSALMLVAKLLESL